MMQNNERSNENKFRRFFREKGYYIVLALCICAVGVSGWLFLSGAAEEKTALAEPTLSVATSAAIPAEKPAAAGETTRPAEKPAAAKPTEKPTAPAVGTTDEKVFAAASSIRVWPVSGQTLAGYATEQLAYNPTTQDWRTHDGVDLAAETGSPVKAACAGTVTAVFDDDYLGTTVVIRHEDGFETQYSNLAAMPTVSAGDTVAAGDVIGSVGQTALLEIGAEPHLHFAVAQDGASVEPANFID